MPTSKNNHGLRWGVFGLSVITCLVMMLHPAGMDVAPPPPSIRLRILGAIAIAILSPLILPIHWAGRIAIAICWPVALFVLTCAGVCAWSMYNGTFMDGIQ